MENKQMIKGFSRLSAEEKVRLVTEHLDGPEEARDMLESFKHPDKNIQEILSSFSENTLSNYHLPYNVAPNFLINDKMYMVPMVTEESSVVAAASAAARFWAERGGFNARVLDVEKNGQVHFLFAGDQNKLKRAFPDIIVFLREKTKALEQNMIRRGGGILRLELIDRTSEMANCFQLHATFNTADAMGANFINSCLEQFAEGMGLFFEENPGFDPSDYEPLMAILSNYTPACIAEAKVSCKLGEIGEVSGMNAVDFARRFSLAVEVAGMDVYRATTHNKGIMNGVDAVILATGNDFRAVEAAAHAYAARSGRYTSLSQAEVKEGVFSFSLQIPLAIGTLGGLTNLHPLASLSLDILGKPDARHLMMIAAAAGLANNFAAVRSLVTTGIQAGHMWLHLPNILQQLHASEAEKRKALDFFEGKKVSHQAVKTFLNEIRKKGG
jgi:hydroxymethylglutaryl-CoA reductase